MALRRHLVDRHQFDVQIPQKLEQLVHVVLIGNLSDEMAQTVVDRGDLESAHSVEHRRARTSSRYDFVGLAQGDLSP
jgi:hypothetical protein